MTENFFNLKEKPSEKKELSVSLLILVFVLIVIAGFIFLQEHNVEDLAATLTTDTEEREETALLVEEEEEDEEKEKEEEVVEPKEEITTVPGREGYHLAAQKGEGLTHLARRAISQYMQKESMELTPEERIYMEDYVQRRVLPEGPRLLELGEEVEISFTLIREAREKAGELAPQELENLQQYTAFVSF